MMNDLIRREDALNQITAIDTSIIPYAKAREYVDILKDYVIKIIEDLPSAEPKMITIEEVSNQLGCATIQSALYWFEFLKTLDLLGFAIVRKETR